MERNGAAVIIASLILGVCVLSAAWIIGASIQDVTASLGEMQGTITALGEGLDEIAAAPAAPARAPERRRGLDPNRKYTVATAGSPSRGPEDAEVTVVEFSDFQCPFCSRVNPTLLRLRQEYGDKVRIVFKHLPLESIHPRAPAAHAASEAAKLQGKFWEMHDKIFANQRELSDARYVEWATELGLDVERFKRDVASAEVVGRVRSDSDEASALGVTGTPAFFINGKYLSGARPFPDFKRVVDAELAG